MVVFVVWICFVAIQIDFCRVPRSNGVSDFIHVVRGFRVNKVRCPMACDGCCILFFCSSGPRRKVHA